MIEEKFWSRVEEVNGCLLWTMSLGAGGYAQMWYGGKKQYCHRISYLLTIGSIPKNKHLDHLCRIRHCVNPEHLEPVTPKENMRRGMGIPALNKRKTYCKRGHKFTRSNTYRNPNNGSRTCRRCHRVVIRDYMRRVRAKKICQGNV